jgi:hypothetical protein
MEAMTVEQALNNAKGMTFEKFWALLMEDRERMAQSHAQTEALMAQTQANIDETNRVVREMSKRVDKVTANVGGLNRSLGELIETLMAGRLWEKFPEYNLARAYQRVPIFDKDNVAKTDVDILLIDSEWAMAVEVKREAHEDDIDHHLRRMDLIKKYPPTEVLGKKKLLGAIAGALVPPDVREKAQSAGFFVLEMNGEHVSRVESPKGFKARVW